MLNSNFKVVGIGVAHNGASYFKYYWTADFGGYDDSGGGGDDNPPQLNNPPAVPNTPSDPSSGHVGASYAFSVSSMDPDGDLLRYTFDWGDGTFSATEYFASGCVASLSHSWNRPGTFIIRVMATDAKGSSSDWSPSANFQVSPRVFETVFASNTANVTMLVDGISYSLPVSFNWTEGPVHEVSAKGDHNFTEGGRLLFKGWDDVFQDETRLVVASSPRVYTVLYETQYRLLVSPYPSVQNAEWRCAGETVQLSVDSTVISQGDGVRLLFAGWSNGDSAQTINVTMSMPFSVEARWKRQFLVRVRSDYGTVEGEGWCDESSNVSISVHPWILEFANGTRRVFNSWFGEGLGNYTGSCLNATVSVKAPINETAVWKAQYLVALESPYGNPSGAGWYDQFSIVNISVETMLYESPATRLVFLRWEGAAGSRDANFSIVVCSPVMLKAVWTKEFYLNVTSPYGETWGSGWYPEGTVASFGINPPGPSFISEVFDGWNGDVELRALNATVLMDGPKKAVAKWRRDYLTAAAFFVTVAMGVSMLICIGRRRGSSKSVRP